MGHVHAMPSVHMCCMYHIHPHPHLQGCVHRCALDTINQHLFYG